MLREKSQKQPHTPMNPVARDVHGALTEDLGVGLWQLCVYFQKGTTVSPCPTWPRDVGIQPQL